MPTTLTPPSVDQTDQLAQNLPGLAAEPAIAAVEQGLLDFLSTPPQQILGGLPLQQFPGQQPPADPEAPADPGLANQIESFLQLIAPMLGGFGTLGNGKFDPTQILGPVSGALDAITSPMQQARGSVAHDWQGASGAAADEKARLAIGKGADVANRADALRDNMSTAASNVAQARTRMIEIADEYQAKMAAIDLSTPSGRAAAVAAANEATEESTAVMQELQATLGLQAQQVSAIAEPLQVTNATGAGGATTGGPSNPLMGLARLDPTGVLPTVFGDPRLTPQGLTGNFMDLLFAPQTLTDMNQTLKQTNSTIGNTNTIMTGLGNTLTETNSTIGRTNNIMTGLGNTLSTTNGLMYDANGNLARMIGPLASVSSVLPGMSGDLAAISGAMPGAVAGVDRANYLMEHEVVPGMEDAEDATRDAEDATRDAEDATRETGDEIAEVNDKADEVSEWAEDAVDYVQDFDPTNVDGGIDVPMNPL